MGQSKTLQKRNKTNQVSPKLYRNETKRTRLVQNFTETKQNELGQSTTLQKRNKTNWVTPKLCEMEAKRTIALNFTETKQNELGQSKTSLKRNKTNQVSPKLSRNKTKRTGLVQNLIGSKQSEQIRPKPGKIEEETKWFSPNRIEAKRTNLLKSQNFVRSKQN